MSGELLFDVRNTKRKKKRDFFDGPIFCLPLQRFYYHFVTEELPRLVLLQKSKIDFQVITVRNQPNYVSEYLQKLNVVFELVEAQNIQIASYLYIDDHELIDFHKIQELKDALLVDNSDNNLEIFVSRKGSSRYNPTLENKIRNRFPEMLEVALDGMPIDKQLSIFSKARMIVACHGSNLTNMIWAKPGSIVVEVFDGAYRDENLKKLALNCGHNYKNLTEEFVP
jgi:capsular polysaccharide biosynthesis protein